jgi:hypothetical protein
MYELEGKEAKIHHLGWGVNRITPEMFEGFETRQLDSFLLNSTTDRPSLQEVKD